MALIYLDTSVVVPYYAPEPLSGAAERLVTRQACLVSDLVEVEFFSVLARRRRERTLSAEDARRIGAAFLGHLEAGLYARTALERRHYRMAREWLATLEIPLRVPDALHAAVALAGNMPLATADRALSIGARALGVEIRLLKA